MPSPLFAIAAQRASPTTVASSSVSPHTRIAPCRHVTAAPRERTQLVQDLGQQLLVPGLGGFGARTLELQRRRIVLAVAPEALAELGSHPRFEPRVRDLGGDPLSLPHALEGFRRLPEVVLGHVALEVELGEQGVRFVQQQVRAGARLDPERALDQGERLAEQALADVPLDGEPQESVRFGVHLGGGEVVAELFDDGAEPSTVVALEHLAHAPVARPPEFLAIATKHADREAAVALKAQG